MASTFTYTYTHTHFGAIERERQKKCPENEGNKQLNGVHDTQKKQLDNDKSINKEGHSSDKQSSFARFHTKHWVRARLCSQRLAILMMWKVSSASNDNIRRRIRDESHLRVAARHAALGVCAYVDECGVPNKMCKGMQKWAKCTMSDGVNKMWRWEMVWTSFGRSYPLHKSETNYDSFQQLLSSFRY